ncbi:IS200/IS605 family transposase [Bremerella alba]|uniref:IS200/IS605 family transposase n=1 Tax=Bremerella alba TaxID=980252 RepID=UPI0028F45913|nr:IS200/IS605 family transposase [Bremerella alba]
MPQSYARLYVHIIFSTRQRKRWIQREWAPRLYEYFAGTIRRRNSDLVLAGGVEDHVHLLVSLSREACVADVVRDVKAASSSWVHENIREASLFAWQNGYSAFSVSHSALPDVKNYIANQEDHHQTWTFREKLIAFFARHEIEFQEEYLDA